MANVSVGKLFVAGVVPGLFMAFAMSITVHRVCRKMGYGARSPRASDGVRREHAATDGWVEVGLRPYQAGALSAWELAGRRGVVVLPTGSGKTHVALAAMSWTRLPALCLVPTAPCRCNGRLAPGRARAGRRSGHPAPAFTFGMIDNDAKTRQSQHC